MTNVRQLRMAAIGEVLPAAMLMWKVGNRLLSQTGRNPVARRWARVGAACAGLAGVAAVLSAVANTDVGPNHEARLSDRLQDELEDSFPASDPPAITRSGGLS